MQKDILQIVMVIDDTVERGLRAHYNQPASAEYVQQHL